MKIKSPISQTEPVQSKSHLGQTRGLFVKTPIKPNQSKHNSSESPRPNILQKCAACRSFPQLNWGPSSSWSFFSGRLKTTPMMMMMMWLKSKLFGKRAHQFGRGLNRPNNLKTWWDSFHKCNEKIRKDLRAWKDRDSVNNHQGQFSVHPAALDQTLLLECQNNLHIWADVNS